MTREQFLVWLDPLDPGDMMLISVEEMRKWVLGEVKPDHLFRMVLETKPAMGISEYPLT